MTLKIGDKVKINIAPHYGPSLYSLNGTVSTVAIIEKRASGTYYILFSHMGWAWKEDELLLVDVFRELIRKALRE
jgi:hypothetical protein